MTAKVSDIPGLRPGSVTVSGFYEDATTTVERTAPFRFSLPHLAGQFRCAAVRIESNYATGKVTVHLTEEDRARFRRYLAGPTKVRMRALHAAYRTKRRHW